MTQHDNILIVPVQSNWSEFEINTDGILDFWKHGHVIVGEIDLPPGQWRILGRAKELTEEQWTTGMSGYLTEYDWEKIVEKVHHGYKDYEFNGEPYATAMFSGLSLLRSHGIDPETNPLILVKNERV